jgi:phosphatidylserine decarboxylase
VTGLGQLHCIDRSTGERVEELIPHEWMLRRLAGTRLGRLGGDLLFSRRFFSRIATWYSHAAGSRGRIDGFIESFAVDMSEYEAGDFETFNDFFIRRFRAGARTFESDPGRLPAWAEGACLAWERLCGDETFPVKGQYLTAAALLGDAEAAAPFAGGPALLIRLRPQDYHRFHHADAGPVRRRWELPGRLHTVNLLALRHRPDTLVRNCRQVTLQDSQNFGRLAYVEVGAVLVGRIVQTGSDKPARGDEKGYFEYGGSTVILFGEPGAWRPDDDLLRNTADEIETLVRLGMPVATAAA